MQLIQSKQFVWFIMFISNVKLTTKSCHSLWNWHKSSCRINITYLKPLEGYSSLYKTILIQSPSSINISLQMTCPRLSGLGYEAPLFNKLIKSSSKFIEINFLLSNYREHNTKYNYFRMENTIIFRMANSY